MQQTKFGKVTDFNIFPTSQGYTHLKTNFPTWERMQTTHSHPINAPHFWVYDLQCAFTPQFTPLSKSASGPTVGSELKSAELELSPPKILV